MHSPVRCIPSIAALVWAGALCAAELPDGKALYNTYCAACHASGAAGAPRTGDAAAWERRAKKGINALYAVALKGQGAMPARGGHAALTDAQVMAAVNHMLGASVAVAVPAAPKPAAIENPAAREPSGGGAGKTVYQVSCAACHTSGVAGAPKLGDATAWSSRLGNGLPALYAAAIKGKGAMPPKGGNAGLGDGDVRAAVDFIAGQVKRAAPAAASAPGAKNAAAAPPIDAAEPEPVRTSTAGPGLLSAPASQALADPNAFHRLFAGPGQRNASPAEDGIHDPASPGTGVLQLPALAFERLARSNAGNYVNWVAALGRKQIQPRWDLKAVGDPPVMDMNIVREVKGTMPDVVYPHKQHTEWLDCANCHPSIFVPQKGANRMSMASIVMGQGCGTCHGKVAFPISECRLCHSKNKEGVVRSATSAR